MDLNQQSIHDVIHPTAAFSPPALTTPIFEVKTTGLDWSCSILNPKNRIDSLDLVPRSHWRIDGCTAYGSQYYTVPTFMKHHPLRIDLFIPEPATLPPAMREVLDVDAVFHTRDADRIANLGITRHILRILNHWTSTQTHPSRIFNGVPFGSRIVCTNFPVDVREAHIAIAPTHYVEQHLLSVPGLEANWGSLQLPPTIDIAKFEFVLQLHDSVCLVKLDEKLWIMKALANHTKYMYHELRHLLSIPPHANIVSQPSHLITKVCSFGGKVAVVGFTLEYHEYGSLRDLIPFLLLHGVTTPRTAVKWSSQLASALIHLRKHTGSFYPDLRLDNIVLSADGRVVMVDFEQRGVWCEFAAPEVNAFDYLRIIATDEAVDPAVREKYADLLEESLPQWNDLEEGEEYRWPSKGYNVAWKCLTAIEQEACEVYMLGRVLWCLFEGHSAPQRAAVWISYRWEPQIEFPEYARTPLRIRNLIDRCTRGRSPGLGKVITREGNRLILRALEGSGQSTPGLVQDTARSWWREELRLSEQWLHARAQGLRNGDWNENFYERPNLQQVLKYLEDYQASAHEPENTHLEMALKSVLGHTRF